MYSFGKRSLACQDGVHPDLVRVINKVMSLQIMDFTIYYGVRTPEKRNESDINKINGVILEISNISLQPYLIFYYYL